MVQYIRLTKCMDVLVGIERKVLQCVSKIKGCGYTSNRKLLFIHDNSNIFVANDDNSNMSELS